MKFISLFKTFNFFEHFLNKNYTVLSELVSVFGTYFTIYRVGTELMIEHIFICCGYVTVLYSRIRIRVGQVLKPDRFISIQTGNNDSNKTLKAKEIPYPYFKSQKNNVTRLLKNVSTH